jgi:ankyrin repeat protein
LRRSIWIEFRRVGSFYMRRRDRRGGMDFEIRSASLQQPLRLSKLRSLKSLPFGLVLFLLFVLHVPAYEIPQANAEQSQEDSSGDPAKSRVREIPEAPRPIDEQLLTAAEKGNLVQVKTLLKEGAEINAKGVHGETPLMLAARKGHLDMVNFLLGAGADVHARNKKHPWQWTTALTSAADGGHAEIFQLLLEKIDHDRVKDFALLQALVAAARKGHLQILNVLVDKDPEKNAPGSRGDMALVAAAEAGQLEWVKLLLDKGFDAKARDGNGTTALMRASRGDHVEVVKLLLDRGADVNAMNCNGETALTFGHKLVSRSSGRSESRIEVARLLIDRGARHSWDVYRILFWVANGGDSEIAKLLLKGTDINFNVDKNTNTPFEPPLLWAARGGEAKVVRLLVESGADINIKDPVGRTALKMAKEHGHKKIAEYLRVNGAKE